MSVNEAKMIRMYYVIAMVFIKLASLKTSHNAAKHNYIM